MTGLATGEPTAVWMLVSDALAALLPLRYRHGHDIFRHSKVLWAVLHFTGRAESDDEPVEEPAETVRLARLLHTRTGSVATVEFATSPAFVCAPCGTLLGGRHHGTQRRTRPLGRATRG